MGNKRIVEALLLAVLFTGEGNNNLGSLFQNKPMGKGIWAVPLSNRTNIQDFCTWNNKEEKGCQSLTNQGMKGEIAHLNI